MNEFTFTDSRFVTAQEKHRVVKEWVRFLKGGCKREHFTNGLYEHLTSHCGFIAHYDRDGFYRYYFTDPKRKPKFFAQFDETEGCHSAELGWRGWLNGGYADINQAMVKVAAGYIFRITADCDDEAHRRDLAQAKALLLKYGLAEIAQQVPSLAQCAQTTGTQLSLV